MPAFDNPTRGAVVGDSKSRCTTRLDPGFPDYRSVHGGIRIHTSTFDRNVQPHGRASVRDHPC